MIYYGHGRGTKWKQMWLIHAGSGINLVVTVQYRGIIENNKSVSENVETVDPKNILSIRRYRPDILSREGVTRWIYSDVQSCMLSHRSESFNSGMSLKWKAWICVSMFTSSLRKSAKAQQYLPKSCRIEIRSQIINWERELTKVNISTSYRALSFGDFYHSSKYLEGVLRYEA